MSIWTDVSKGKACILPYLNALNKLGSYCLVEANLNKLGKARVVVGQNPQWLADALAAFFARPITQLSLQQVQAFLAHLNRQLNKPGLIKRLFKATAYKCMQPKNSAGIYYLEELKDRAEQRAFFLAVIGQYLIEQLTRRDSRLVPISIEQSGIERRHWAVLIISKKKNMPPRLWDPSARYPELNNQELPYLETWINSTTQNAKMRVTVRTRDLQISQPIEPWNAKQQSFGMISATGKVLDFKIQGRSPAEKRFRAEEKQIANARDQDLVPVELCFHPYWFQFGHTTLRIGEALYELTKYSWKKHGQGADKARGFIFNNPFAKHQLEQYAADGMPPISLGCSLLISKRQLSKLQAHLDQRVNAAPEQQEQFSLLTNNCNHGVMRALEDAGLPGFSPKGYPGFSSVLSFRKTLLTPQIQVDQRYIYPLPGTPIDPQQIRGWIPSVLYRHNSVPREILRGWFLVPAKMGRYHAKQWLSQIKRAAKRHPEHHSNYEVIER